MPDNLYIGAIIILLATSFYCITSLLRYKTRFNTQTAKLVQLYLDKQFITRIFRMLAISKNDKSSFVEIITNIKEYFQLDDIIFYKLLTKQDVEISPGVFKRNIITQYVSDHKTKIMELLEFRKMVIEKFKIGALDAMIYIVALEDNNPETLILFTQYSNDELDSSDLETLSNSIRVILSVLNKKKNNN